MRHLAQTDGALAPCLILVDPVHGDLPVHFGRDGAAYFQHADAMRARPLPRDEVAPFGHELETAILPDVRRATRLAVGIRRPIGEVITIERTAVVVWKKPIAPRLARREDASAVESLGGEEEDGQPLVRVLR